METERGGVWDEANGLVFLDGGHVFDMHHLYASLETQVRTGASRAS